ncbi:MAG: hypothetical protein V1907_02010 [Candidatus Kerfeldbacteria bacterium]
MPDINLLADTKGTESNGKPKKVPPLRIEYSKPEDRKGVDRPLTKPSGILLWFRSLFTRKPGGKKVVPPKPREVVPKFGKLTKEPEDIFANLEAPEIVLMQRRSSDQGNGVSPRGTRITQEPAGSSGGVRPQQQKPQPTVTTPPEPMIEGGPLRMPAAPRIVPFKPQQPMSAPAVTPLKPQQPVQQLRREQQRGPMPKPEKKKGAEAEYTEEFEGVNLLPEEMVTTFNPKKKLTTVGLVALATALFVGIVDVSLVLWKDTQVRKTDEKRQETDQVIAKIKALEPDQQKAIAFKAQNDVMRMLLNNHTYWTKFLSLFERYTLPTVYYAAGIQTSIGSNLSLTGSAPDMETILEQLALYQKAPEYISSVSINTITRQPKESGFSFIVDLSFNRNAYYMPIDVAAAANTNAPTAQPSSTTTGGSL